MRSGEGKFKAKLMWSFLTAFITAALVYGHTAIAESATVGVPEVVDGETVRVGGKTFRLYGIDSPDIAQTCEIRGRTYNCGRVSMTALMDLVAGVNIRCVPRRGSAATPVSANCFADGYDLSEGMVHTGWALAMPRVGTKYARIEARAKNAKRGLWKGKFTLPWEWQR
jgi:endonuclease YncB( thermonuclease family)